MTITGTLGEMVTHLWICKNLAVYRFLEVINSSLRLLDESDSFCPQWGKAVWKQKGHSICTQWLSSKCACQHSLPISASLPQSTRWVQRKSNSNNLQDWGINSGGRERLSYLTHSTHKNTFWLEFFWQLANTTFSGIIESFIAGESADHFQIASKR